MAKIHWLRLTAPQDVKLYRGGYDGELLAQGASIIEDRKNVKKIRAYPIWTVKLSDIVAWTGWEQ